MRSLLILILLLMAAVPSRASTYYISKSSGADSNSGTAKGTPWAHLPGMASCTLNCSGHTPVAGDTFILMGCDTWVNSDLPILWNWSGSAGSPITIGGEDQTWYNTAACPSAWNRPVFDAQKEVLSPDVIFRAASVGNTSHVNLDSVEMRGLYCAGSCSGAQNYIGFYENATYWTFSNLYLHGWNIVTDGNCFIIQGSPSTIGTIVETSIIDGSDATGASPAGATCYAFYPSIISTISNNVIHDLANGIVGGVGSGNSATISGNLIYNIKESNAGSHPNALEILGAGTYYVHDNVIHDNVGESFMFGNTGETDYIWNNVWYNILGNVPEAPQQPGQTGMTFYAWNNTVVPYAGGTCFLWNSGDGGTFTAVTIENTHCISTGSVAPSSWNGTAATLTTNLLMSPTTAATDGYTSSQTCAYPPTSNGSPTVGQGTNLTGKCSGSLALLCSDTAYAVFYNSIAQSVTVPARTSNGRPSSGNWDVGAYQYGDPSPPAAPTLLPSTVH